MDGVLRLWCGGTGSGKPENGRIERRRPNEDQTRRLRWRGGGRVRAAVTRVTRNLKNRKRRGEDRVQRLWWCSGQIEKNKNTDTNTIPEFWRTNASENSHCIHKYAYLGHGSKTKSQQYTIIITKYTSIMHIILLNVWMLCLRLAIQIQTRRKSTQNRTYYRCIHYMNWKCEKGGSYIANILCYNANWSIRCFRFLCSSCFISSLYI